MNTNSNDLPRDEIDQRLDDALQHWGEKFTADPSSIDSAKAKTLDMLSRESSIETLATSREDSYGSWKLVASLAACVAVLAAGVWLFLPSTPSLQVASDQIDSAALEIAKPDSKKQKIVLARFRELFGEQLNFVSEVDDDLQFSLDDSNETRSDESHFLAVEIVLLSRSSNAGEPGWKILHRASVLARSEQRVDTKNVESPFGFSLWAIPVADDLVSIDLHCRLSGANPIDVVTSELQRSGSAEQIHAFARSGVDYRLYQTGTRIDPKSFNDEALHSAQANSIVAMSSRLEASR